MTRVEQLEERERLRDRLAALGEMAAAIAHEVKNPLAGIEVMAGLLKRQLTDSPDAQTILADIIKEAKMANAIVLEVLEFVRPIRLQVERISLADAIRDAVTLSESHGPRAGVRVDVSLPADLPAIQGDPHQLRQIVTNLLINAYEAMNGKGAVGIAATSCRRTTLPGGGENTAGPMIQVEVDGRRPGDAAGSAGQDFLAVLHDQAAGVGSGTGDCPEDRRRARRAHRRERDPGGRHALPRHPAGVGESRVVQALSRVHGSRLSGFT